MVTAHGLKERPSPGFPDNLKHPVASAKTWFCVVAMSVSVTAIAMLMLLIVANSRSFTGIKVYRRLADRPIRHPITIKNINVMMSRFEHDYEMIVSLPSPSGGYKVTGNIIGGVTFIFRAK
jgi:hypothetical protein